MIDDHIYPISANIGIIPEKCIYWLHTHDNSGLIHIESPIKENFTLGQFLHIWKLFDNSDIVHDIHDIADNKLMEILVYMLTMILILLQLEPTSIGTNYSNSILRDQDIILMNITT